MTHKMFLEKPKFCKPMIQVCYVCCLGSQLYFVELGLELGIACMLCFLLIKEE